tara:strand:+ start:1253 stop:1978 length:726 start_codon:yes stop_codon:yes gene_type:complete
MTKNFNLEKLNVKIYADGADLKNITQLNKYKFIEGFTTNPSLIKQSGYKNYMDYAKALLKIVKKKPVSLEIFSNNYQQMIDDSLKLSRLGKNVFVKIPVVNTNGRQTINLIDQLNQKGIKLNITAIFTIQQVKTIIKKIKKPKNIILSVFAGRIADTGRNPKIVMRQIKKMCKQNYHILWASTREIYSIYDANDCKSDIITVPHSILKKINLIGKSLEKYSIETVKTFYEDAKSKGYSLNE